MTNKKDPKYIINALVRQRDAALARVVELEAHLEFMQEQQARAVHEANGKAEMAKAQLDAEAELQGDKDE